MPKLEGGLRLKGIYKKSLPNKPLITVITVVLNNERDLEDCIRSVVNQTYNNLEYIIVDGGSVDGTLDIVKKYQDKIDYWQSEKDGGIYDAMNKGIRLATGEWIHLLNSDDYYLANDVLEKAIQYLDNSGRYFYYFTLIFQPQDNKQRIQRYPFNFFNYLRLYYSAYVPHPTLFVLKNQYEVIGLYDVNFKIAADHDMILRLSKRYKPIFIDIPMVVMRGGGYSGKSFFDTFEDFKRVTIKNGLNPILAEIFFRFKIWKFEKFIQK